MEYSRKFFRDLCRGRRRLYGRHRMKNRPALGVEGSDGPFLGVVADEEDERSLGHQPWPSRWSFSTIDSPLYRTVTRPSSIARISAPPLLSPTCFSSIFPSGVRSIAIVWPGSMIVP